VKTFPLRNCDVLFCDQVLDNDPNHLQKVAAPEDVLTLIKPGNPLQTVRDLFDLTEIVLPAELVH
jgi:hypothetical protein